ncbi:unnamed protein product [Caenorhabditis bovis]|uniref:Uncharacterized protein n=1 Tax=Caenorhabditis bovis TaxID=2654633 RepID=A0A8S1EVL8_9PELO|nr:unnamed protein product [Caenorhabditis bovis]
MPKKSTHFGYGALLLIAFILTIVALFTPGWRSYKGSGAPDLGLVTRYCGDGNRQVNEFDCRAWHKSQLPFEKATLGLVVMALIFEFFSICCFFGLFSSRAQLGVPALSTTFLAFVCMLIAIIVYGVRMQYKIAYLQSTTFELLANVYLGYSYWLAVIAAIFLFFATGVTSGFLKKQGETHLH